MSNTWDRVERLLGADNLALLAQKKVGIVGLGSGGGFVAQSLAMSGVGNFVLIDSDTLENANVVRHVADLRDVGKAKAQVLADLIQQRNPAAHCEVYIGKIEDHLETLHGLDLLIVGVDQEQVKYVINEVCLAQNLTAVYAGVYERGEGGDVVILHPNSADEPCYACWAAELREGLALSEISNGETLDYGMIGENGTLESEPGLWLHVVRVASAQADIALNELLRGGSAHVQMPGNTVIMANRPLEIVEGVVSPPYSAVWTSLYRDPHCLVCGDVARHRLSDAQDTPTADALSLDDLMASSGMTLEDNRADE